MIKKFSIAVLVLFGGMWVVSGVKNLKEKNASKALEAPLVSLEEPLDRAPVLDSEVSLEEPKAAKVDRIRLFFSKGSDRFPIVETLHYSSHVSWLKGRSAWIGDYARHYQTSKHFIARSLHGKSDYFSQKIGVGDQFNVLRNDVKFNFHLLVDLSRLTLLFYYQDLDKGERVFVKEYPIRAGKQDPSLASGYLTPMGTFQLGSKSCVYHPGQIDFYKQQKQEMIQIFGTRWIPFDKAIGEHSDSPKGYGIHGLSSRFDNEKGEYVEDLTVLGTHSSDGCICLKREDIEELFAIIVSRDTFIEIVPKIEDFAAATTLSRKIPL